MGDDLVPSAYFQEAREIPCKHTSLSVIWLTAELLLRPQKLLRLTPESLTCCTRCITLRCHLFTESSHPLYSGYWWWLNEAYGEMVGKYFEKKNHYQFSLNKKRMNETNTYSVIEGLLGRYLNSACKCQQIANDFATVQVLIGRSFILLKHISVFCKHAKKILIIIANHIKMGKIKNKCKTQHSPIVDKLTLAGI